MLSSAADLQEICPQDHLVQLYEVDEGALVSNVSRFLVEGFRAGSNLVAIATSEHQQAIRSALSEAGVDALDAEQRERLVILDAHETLARFMVDGYPDWNRFDGTVGEVVRRAIAGADGRGLRAYGEMVGVLWKARQFPSAIRLEQLWNKLRRSKPFSLFCAYPIDVFDAEFEVGVLDALLCAHTHLLPTVPAGSLERAIERAVSEFAGNGIDDVAPFTHDNHRGVWPTLPKAEAMILWLRSKLPENADAILARARQYYQTAT